MAGLVQARPAHLESVQCAISHPNTWESMTWGHFCHFQAHMSQLLLFQKVESDGGPFFKVVFKS